VDKEGYRRLREKGICVDCSGIAVTGGARCQNCRDFWKEKKHEEKRITIERLGGPVCAFPGCGSTTNLHIHHDHKLQADSHCCESENGCRKCQVCVLCSKHNVMLAFMHDDPEIALKCFEFLSRKSISLEPKFCTWVSKFAIAARHANHNRWHTNRGIVNLEIFARS
jgi:hypothetical protein